MTLISSTLQKTVIKDLTHFSIKNSSIRQLTAVSAVCCQSSTLYMFSKSSGNERQLVQFDKDINGGDPVCLDICNHHPVSLFGGSSHSTAIDSEGEVIIIKSRDSVINSPNSPIEVSLPNGQNASSVACCEDLIIVLNSNCRIFFIDNRIKRSPHIFNGWIWRWVAYIKSRLLEHKEKK